MENQNNNQNTSNFGNNGINNYLAAQNQNLCQLIKTLYTTNEKLSTIIFLLALPYIISFAGIIVSIILTIISGTTLINLLQNIL